MSGQINKHFLFVRMTSKISGLLELFLLGTLKKMGCTLTTTGNHCSATFCNNLRQLRNVPVVVMQRGGGGGGWMGPPKDLKDMPVYIPPR